MRTFNLLIVLLCGMVSVCAAGDAVRQNSSSQPAENSFTSDLISPSAGRATIFYGCQWRMERISIFRAQTRSATEM